MARGRSKKNKDQYDKELLELAIQTRNWARHIGAFIDLDETDEKRHGYFTVEEWMARFERPHYFWRDVKKKLIAMGESITNDSFGGHYWGKQGDQAKNTVMLIARAMTMLETAHFQLMAMQNTKEWVACRGVLETKLSENRHQLSMDQIPQLLEGAQLDMAASVSKLLLEDGDE